MFQITPTEMEDAYGVNQLIANGNNGAGITIAIVDAYNDPDIVSDAQTFSQTYGLPQFNKTGGPTLKVLNQTGGTTLPGTEQFEWDVEESLDVEWAHSIAPQANIVVFEANDQDTADLFATMKEAGSYPNVAVVSMSIAAFGDGIEDPGESNFDSIFTTPAGHQPVTWLAGSGDSGAPSYPAASPNVVAVGGTALNVSASGQYLGEAVWNADNDDGDTGGGSGGGGVSLYEQIPQYQVGNVNGISSTNRVLPDISMDAGTEVDVIDTYETGAPIAFGVGGTSLAAPMWAGLVALADQLRANASLSSLDGPTQTLPELYNLPNSDFHDITDGFNSTGAVAGPGYDDASGIGSPVANLLVPGLADLPPLSVSTTPGAGVVLGSGTKLTDSVTLVGGDSPTGSITFTLYAPNDTTVVDTETATVSGDGTYSTPNGYLPTALGTYEWVASYSGDSNNRPVVGNKGAEPESVSPAGPTTTVSPTACSSSAIRPIRRAGRPPPVPATRASPRSAMSSS